jgi:hypothetical protein
LNLPYYSKTWGLLQSFMIFPWEKNKYFVGLLSWLSKKVWF